MARSEGPITKHILIRTSFDHVRISFHFERLRLQSSHSFRGRSTAAFYIWSFRCRSILYDVVIAGWVDRLRQLVVAWHRRPPTRWGLTPDSN